MKSYINNADAQGSLIFSGYSLQRNELLRLSGTDKSLYWTGKRIFDIILSFISIVILFVPCAVIALVIFIDDPHGSPIFTQTRVGRHGKEFKFYKFRTMVVNAEALLDSLQSQNEKDGPVFKMKHDPRVTRVGRFLRKTSIDELPQLINIFKGDMSFVGPRPSLPKEAEKYDSYQAQRLFITPGLTCFWQVSNNRDDISFDEWVDLDIKYIQERTWSLDIKLIIATFKSVLTGQGE